MKIVSSIQSRWLYKSVLLALPSYSMNTFKIPKTMCDKCDVIKNIWWNSSLKNNSFRYIAYISWDHLCLPKEVEGFGFWKMEDINLSLLAKLVGNFFVKIIKFGLTSFNANIDIQKIFLIMKHSLLILGFWNIYICSSIALLKLGACLKIGNVSSINI